jgi:hypothetical protein
MNAKRRHRLSNLAVLVGIALVACMAVSATGSAQSIVAVEHAVNSATSLEDHTRMAAQNLTQMLGELNRNDTDAVNAILSARFECYGAYGEVVSIGQILIAIKSVEDQLIVRRFFGKSSRNFVKVADIDIDYINKSLPNIHSPAVLAEATKIRDSMIEMRALFAPFAAQSDN